jgi:hypothetical protein
VASQNAVLVTARGNGNSTRICRDLLRMVRSRRAAEILNDLIVYLESQPGPQPMLGGALMTNSTGGRSRLAG